MSDDVSVDLIRALVAAVGQPSPTTGSSASVPDWESLASGYAYSGPDVTPVAYSWPSIEPAVQAYLRSHYAPGDTLPVKILVQLDRTTGRYRLTFEETDVERWKTRPATFRQMREDLRPSFD
jgi:hypothetical protein